MPRRCLRLIAAAALAAAFAPAASADWLVTRDGVLLETTGPWEVRGEEVVFSAPDGTLLSVRIEEVDLAASRAKTAAAKGEAQRQETGSSSLPAAAAAARQSRARQPPPVAVLQDGDVPRARETGQQTRAEEPKVVLYGTSWCPWCRRTKQLLDSLGVAYVEKDVEKSAAAARELARKAGAQSAVPVLVRGEKVVRGFREAEIRALVADLVAQRPEP